MSKMKQRQDLDVMRPGNVAELSFDCTAVLYYRALRYTNTFRAEEIQPAVREEMRRLRTSRLMHWTMTRTNPPQNITRAQVFFRLALMQSRPEA